MRFCRIGLFFLRWRHARPRNTHTHNTVQTSVLPTTGNAHVRPCQCVRVWIKRMSLIKRRCDVCVCVDWWEAPPAFVRTSAVRRPPYHDAIRPPPGKTHTRITHRPPTSSWLSHGEEGSKLFSEWNRRRTAPTMSGCRIDGEGGWETVASPPPTDDGHRVCDRRSLAAPRERCSLVFPSASRVRPSVH